MDITIKNHNLTFNPRQHTMRVRVNERTADVSLCFEFDNINYRGLYAFAMINMHNGTLPDKKSQLPALKKLAQDICDCYNAKKAQ